MENLDASVVKHLQPFFYLVGLIVISHLGMIVKFFVDHSHKDSKRLNYQLDTLHEDVNTLSKSVLKLETKFDMFTAQYTKDLNNIGQKVREIAK